MDLYGTYIFRVFYSTEEEAGIDQSKSMVKQLNSNNYGKSNI